MKKHKRKPDKGRSELAEFFSDLRIEAKILRANCRTKDTDLIMSLEREGYKVQKLSEYQFRINGAVDLYPTNRRFHDLRNNSRGSYSDLFTFIQKRLPK